jgi:hypothetical protein
MMTTNTKLKPAALVLIVAAFALVGGAIVPTGGVVVQPAYAQMDVIGNTTETRPLAPSPPIGGDTSAQSLAQEIIDRTYDRIQDTLDELGIDIDFADEPSNGNGPIVGGPGSTPGGCSVSPETGEVFCE